ncbi:MAG: ribonuclease III [Acidimicrobiales bacterium]
MGLPVTSALLEVALTHSSYAAENGCESNERLEFLGDAVVDLAVADLIVTGYPRLDQGEGSLVRSRVVNEASLATAAARLDLAAHVRLGKGEVKKGGRERPALLADAFEALVAALYLERGYEAARAFVADQLGDDVAAAAQTPNEVDPKARLTQWALENGRSRPHYAVVAEGPSHARTFQARVSLDGAERGRGEGTSKKSAEAAAATAALAAIDA